MASEEGPQVTAKIIDFPSVTSRSQFGPIAAGLIKPSYDKSSEPKYKNPKSDEEIERMSGDEAMDYYDLGNHATECPCGDCERAFGPSTWNNARYEPDPPQRPNLRVVK